MKATTFKAKDFKFTADVWKYTERTDAEGGNIRTYVFDRAITLVAQTGMFGRLNLEFPDDCEDLFVGHRLENVKDAGGVELQKSAIWEIDQFVPNINLFGRREGFKGRAVWFGAKV